MAKPIKVTIFSYQVGFGDCFLLRFTYDTEEGPRRHVLIDFGSTGLPENASATHMLKVACDIAKKCTERNGESLDVVVATHRHADHISGFATRSDGQGTGDIIARLEPKVVVQPWTEAPEAPVDWPGPEESSSVQAFNSLRRSLQAMNDTAKLAISYSEGKAVPRHLASEMGFVGEVNLANLSAIKNLQEMGKKGQQRWVFHGCDIKLDEILPGVEIDVLGPPTLLQTETIRKQTARNKDEFWQLQPQGLAAATKAAKGPSVFPDATYRLASKLFTEQRWLSRRIDELNSELMLSLVRQLDKQMNNTSVVLLMRVGGKSLLFPGDAQLENWQYTLQSDKAALLVEVDLYKVGHHGSLNATPRSMWAHFRKRGKAGAPDRLTSMLSTKHGKHGSDAKDTEVPRRTLVTELEANSQLMTTEALLDTELYHEHSFDLK